MATLNSLESARVAAETICIVWRKTRGKPPAELISALREALERARPAVTLRFFELLKRDCPDAISYFSGE
jgi:hypothetical protein